MRAKAVAAAAGLVAAGALAPATFAQESQADWCAVFIARGATTPGGAAGTLTVRNVGRPCRIANFTVPEQQVATSRLEVVQAPEQGRLEIIQPMSSPTRRTPATRAPASSTTAAAAPAGRAGSCRSACGSRCPWWGRTSRF
jgi:hypothetical protein